MLKKLLGIKTQDDVDVAVSKGLQQAKTAYKESLETTEAQYKKVLKAMQEDYDKSLKQVTEGYNDKLQVLKDNNDRLLKEIDDLCEDVALALNGKKLLNRESVKIVKFVAKLKTPKTKEVDVDEAMQVDKGVKIPDQDEMIAKVEERIKNASASELNRGGGIEIYEDGNHTVKHFYSEKQLRDILKDVKKGKYSIVEQPGL